MRAATLACSIAALLLLAQAGRLRAQERTALSFVREPGAEDCIAALELGQRVERVVGPVLQSAAEAGVSVEGRIEKRGAGYHAAITIANRAGRILGQRELSSPSPECRSIDAALVFVIAVAIDPDAALAELPGELSDEREPGAELLAELRANAPPPAPPPPPPRTDPETAGARKWQWEKARDAKRPGPVLQLRAALSGQLITGVLPSVSPGAALELGLGIDERPVWLRAAIFAVESRSVAPGLRVDGRYKQLVLGACPLRFLPGPLELLLCAAVIAGLSEAAAGGSSTSMVGVGPRNRLLFGPSLEARLGARLWGPLYAGIRVALDSLWPRTSYSYRASEVTHRAYAVAAVSGEAAAALEVRF